MLRVKRFQVLVIGRLFSKGRKPVGGVFHNPPPFPPVLIGLRTPCTVERGTIGLTSAVRSNKISVSYSCYIQYVYLQYIYIHSVCIHAVHISVSFTLIWRLYHVVFGAYLCDHYSLENFALFWWQVGIQPK